MGAEGDRRNPSSGRGDTRRRFDGDVLGRIRLQLDQQYLVAEVRERVLEVRAALLVALAVVGLFIALLIYRLAISPLSRIDRQVRLLQEKEPQSR